MVAQEYCVGVGREFDVSPCRHSGSSNNSEMKALPFAVTSVVIPTCLDSLVVSYKEDRAQAASSKKLRGTWDVKDIPLGLSHYLSGVVTSSGLFLTGASIISFIKMYEK